MKRILTTLMLAAALAAGAGAQGKNLVTRHLLVLPQESTGLEALGADQQCMLANMTYCVFTEAMTMKPVLLAKKAEDADSTLATTVEAGAGGADVVFTMLEKDAAVHVERFRYVPGKTTLEEYSAAVRSIAQGLVPYLQDVEPVVTVDRKEKEERLARIVKAASFEDALAKSRELTVWGGGVYQPLEFETSGGGFSTRIEMPYVFHASVDLGIYSPSNVGLLLSVLVDKNNVMHFASYDTVVDGDRQVLSYVESDNLLTLGGVGVSYRTLGRLSAQFNWLVYLGAVTFTPKEATNHIYSSSSNGSFDKVLQLDKGQSATFFYSTMSVQTCLALALTERFSIKTRMAINVDPRLAFNSTTDTYAYDRRDNTMYTYLGEIGFSVRF